MKIVAFEVNSNIALYISPVSPNNVIEIIINSGDERQSPCWLVLITCGSDILNNNMCFANYGNILKSGVY